MPNIDELPEHVFTQILRYVLPTYPRNNPPVLAISTCGHTTLPALAHVSRHWRRLLFSPTVYRRVQVLTPSNCPTTPEHFEEFLNVLHQVAPGVEELTFYNISTDSNTPFATLLPNLPAFPKVKDLCLCGDPRLTLAEWTLLVGLFPKVESFSNFFKDEWVDGSLQQMAAGWPQLVEFIVNLSAVTGAGLIEFCTIANRLHTIDLQGMRDLTDRHVDVITQLLGNSLKYICIGSKQDNLTASAIQFVAQNCPLLEKIEISKPMYMGHVSDLVHLRRLRMEFGDGPCEGLDECFYRPFGQLRTFMALDAPYLTDAHLRRIANSCPMLETFTLTTTIQKPNRCVTDSGVDQLVNQCHNLTHLTVIGCPLLTDRRSFILEKLPNLNLSITGNGR